MNCENLRESFRDWTRQPSMPRDAARHLAGCPECAAAWERERLLTAQLRDLAADGHDAAPSPAVEQRLMAEFRRRAPRRRFAPRPAWALAAAALLVAVGLYWFARRNPARQAATARESAPLARATDFYSLRPGALLLEGEPAQLIRMRLPRAEMRRFGFAVQPEWERSLVEAEVLVGQDGSARAVRFVH